MTDIITTQTQEEIDAAIDGESIIVIVQSEPSQVTTVEQVITATATVEQPVQTTTIINIGPEGPDGPMGVGFQPDAIGLFSERATYDAEPEGFSFLAHDLGQVFFRVGVSGWSAGIAFTTGLSAYEVAVANGFVGTEAQWLTSLEGTDGLSAYQQAVNAGFVGTEAQWLASLEGTDGLSAYQQAVNAGFVGTEAQWLASLEGADGLSAYQLSGFAGTEQEWLDSLQGESFKVDAVGLFSERSLYDAELSGFTFLASDQNLLYFKETVGWSEGVPFGEKGDSFTVDAVGLFSERSLYDAQPEGFSFLATDLALLYFRQGIGWSEGILFGKGDKGDTGDTGPSGVYTGPVIYVQSLPPDNPPNNSVWFYYNT